MKNDDGYLSIDFLAGFAIFMIAFIWVASMIPGLFVNVKGTQIDYDAVAYRSGVILTEDPGWQVDGTSDWETIGDDRAAEEVTRIGWALSKDTPGILSESKINRTFCATAFTYPESYQSKIIFGDMPYRFNISVLMNGTYYQSLGDVRPLGAHGYIRRVVKVKRMSNATIDAAYFLNGTAPVHMFSPELNITELLAKEPNLAYQINPRNEPTSINITNLSSIWTNDFNQNWFEQAPLGPSNMDLRLLDVNITRLNPSEPLVAIPPYGHEVYVDGSATPVIPRESAPFVVVRDNVSIMFNSSFFSEEGKTTTASRVFVEFKFGLWNKTGGPLGLGSYDAGFCVNSSNLTSLYPGNHFSYMYGSPWVSEPHLEPAIVEVAIW